MTLERPPAGTPVASDSGTFSVRPVGWRRVGDAGAEYLLEIAVVNNRPRAALLSPDSLVAVLRTDPDRIWGSEERTSRPVDYWERQARLVESARMAHDTSNPYHPDGLGLAYHTFTGSPELDRVAARYSRERWKEAQWDKEHGGQINTLDPDLFQWRALALRDTLLWSHWEARRLFAIPADTSEGLLTFRLRFGGVTDSVIFRQRRPRPGRR